MMLSIDDGLTARRRERLLEAAVVARLGKRRSRRRWVPQLTIYILCFGHVYNCMLGL